jgi:hypothetical protein
MEKKELEFFLDKKIIVQLVNNFKYTGYIKELHDESVFFEDIYIGMILVPLSQIRMVRQFSESELE